MIKKTLIISSAVMLLVIIAFAGWVGYSESFIKKTIINKELLIERGAGFNTIYTELFQGMDTPPGFMIYLKKIKQLPKKLKYGYYSASGITLDEFLNNLVKGIQSTIKVTIPEGFNAFEIASVLERLGVAGKDDFIEKAFDPALSQAITGENLFSMEGFLAPGTYKFPKNYDTVKIIKELYSTFLKTLPADFEAKAESMGLTKYEAVTLASIVQKETYSETEAPIVASVFLNRLKIKMRLQADPTIIYGKYLDFDGNIKKTDIQDKSNIYNTYRHGGLPPTPICNPSAIALNAVVNSADTDYLYFVADKRGNHLFTSNYRQHVNNVRRHQKQ